MSIVPQHELQNRLLSRLSAEDFALLAEALEFRELPRGTTIRDPFQPIAYVLFPERGVVSLVVLTAEGQSAEGGLVGREGLVFSSILLGIDRLPFRTEMQIGGCGHVMKSEDLLTIASKNESIRTRFLLYTHCLIVQATFTAMSNAVHPIEERLARWLLMCHDRSDSDDLALTHKFMAIMLAVRRASVTTALQTLVNNGFVQTDRGYVTIANRSALEEFAGDAYGGPEAEYRRLLGPL